MVCKKNNRIGYHLRSVVFCCVCLLASFTLDAASDYAPRGEKTLSLPPLAETLSPEGKKKAKALAYFAMGCREIREKRGFTPKAEKAFIDALKLNPDSKGALKILLAEWTLKRKPDVLIKKLLPIARIHPEAVNLNLLVANTLRIVNKDDVALLLLKKTFATVIIGLEREKTPTELKAKLLFNLTDLLGAKKKWNEGEVVLEQTFEDAKLADNLIARLAAAKFFAACADQGPDGFLAGWSKRRRKRALLSNLAVLERLCAATEAPPSVLLAICGIYKRYSMPERSTRLVLGQLLNSPNSSAAMLVLAKVFDSNKDYANEVRTWKRIINSKRFADIQKAWEKVHPGKNSSNELYFQLGLAAVKARNWSEAFAAFDWRLLNSPKNVATIFQLGLAQMRRGKFRKALFHFDRLDKLPFALYFAALCHRSLGEYELAFEAISEAENKARKVKFNTILSERFYLDYAMIADKIGKFKTTRTILETLLKNNPEDPTFNNFLGYVLAERGIELERAKKLVAKALAKDPDNEAYLDSMAWVLYKQNRCREALGFINKALKFSGALPDAVIADHAGDINLALGRPQEALKYWKLARSIQSEDLDYKSVADKIKATTETPPYSFDSRNAL